MDFSGDVRLLRRPTSPSSLLLQQENVLIVRKRHMPRLPSSTHPHDSATHETLAHQAFTHGNSCLAAGQFADAIVAFHQARTLEPTHPHVAGRLAEVARRQHAARATPLVNAPG